MKRYVGVDVGGTRIKAGLVNALHQTEKEAVHWLDDADRTQDGLLTRIAELVREVRGDNKVVIVGLGVPGVVSRWDGALVRAPNFPAITHFRIKEALEVVIGEHVAVDNDANCVIAGEYLQGAGARFPDHLGFTLGTGVGGAIVMHGALWRGAKGMAGELGHTVVDPTGPKCGCGTRGCLETFCSGVGLRHMCTAKPVAGVDTASPDLPRLLSEAARGGDATAAGHFATAGRMLGRAVGGYLNIFDMKAVVLAGGLSASWDLMEAGCREELAASSFSEISDGVQFVVGTLGERAGMLGAAMQWMMAPHD